MFQNNHICKSDIFWSGIKGIPNDMQFLGLRPSLKDILKIHCLESYKEIWRFCEAKSKLGFSKLKDCSSLIKLETSTLLCISICSEFFVFPTPLHAKYKGNINVIGITILEKCLSLILVNFLIYLNDFSYNFKCEC